MFSLCLSTIMFSITDPSCLGNQVEVRLMDRAQQESPQHGTKSLKKSIPINPNESSYRGHLGSLVEFMKVQNHLAKALSSSCMRLAFSHQVYIEIGYNTSTRPMVSTIHPYYGLKRLSLEIYK